MIPNPMRVPPVQGGQGSFGARPMPVPGVFGGGQMQGQGGQMPQGLQILQALLAGQGGGQQGAPGQPHRQRELFESAKRQDAFGGMQQMPGFGPVIAALMHGRFQPDVIQQLVPQLLQMFSGQSNFGTFGGNPLMQSLAPQNSQQVP